MKTLLLFATLLLPQLLPAQRIIILKNDPILLQGDSAFYNGDYVRSIQLYKQLSPQGPEVLFNLATAYVGAKEYDSAFQILFTLDMDQIKYTEEFTPLHGQEQWQQLVDKLDARFQGLKQREVAIELHHRYYEDQKYQMMWSWKSRMANAYPAFNRDQLEVLKDDVMHNNVAYVKHTGFLWKQDIGEEGVHITWIIAQHADFDTVFQRAFLREMKKHDVSKIDYAYLTDRVNKNAGQKQVYGTQMKYVGGTMALWPVADSAHLDERRKEVGLVPIAEYLQGLRLLNNH